MNHYRPEKVNRVILKLSGEYLGGHKGSGFDTMTIGQLVEDISELKETGLAIGIVLGGGNLVRGAVAVEQGINRITADNIGMLATIQNALLVSDVLKKRNYDTTVFTAVRMDKIARYYTPAAAEEALGRGSVCFFCAGTGNPFFTTDTAAVLRAVELNADIVLKGTKVDGIYTADPKKDPNARFLSRVTYDEALANQYSVMDMTAFSLARDYSLKMKVFNITVKGNLKEAVFNSEIGTYIYK